jgi:hypothetical protein
MTIFADDLLPLTPDGNGISLGMRPRLRLPLPRGMSANFSRFVRVNKGPSDRLYAYLGLSASLLAPFGKSCPIGALVLLERHVRRPAELTPVSRGMGLQHLLQQNFIRPGGALSTFDRLRELAETKPCYRLIYSDLDEAVHVLRTAFAAKVSSNHASKADRTYIRSPDIAAQIVDGEWFLVSADHSTIFCLNPTARAVWEMLAKPLSEEEAVSVMHEAFPHEEGRVIRRDIRMLFAELKLRGLIRPAADGEPVANGRKQSPRPCARTEPGGHQFSVLDA